MKLPTRLAGLLLAFAPALRAADIPPADWIDPDTGHRVIRLSPDTGGSSLYFHQHSFTPEGDKVILRGAGGIVAVDISALGKTAPKAEVVLAEAAPIATAWRSREAYYMDRQTSSLMAVHLDTKVTRVVVKLPPQARGGQFAINCDE